MENGEFRTALPPGNTVPVSDVLLTVSLDLIPGDC
jgi:hypothetical protein